MAGYSGTPLAKKLGIKADGRVALLGAPAGFEELLDPLPEKTRVMRRVRSPVDVIVAFATTRADLQERLARGQALLRADGGLWVGWPKKSSGLTTELDFGAVQTAGLALGLVDNKICAIDDSWSGLRFVVRKQDRPKWPNPPAP